jgi:tetratricopeptide (TPR) repeat protein
LINLPFLWLAAAIGLAWRVRPAGDPLRGLIVAVTLLFAISTSILCTFAGACDRYEVEFLPALTLLAGIGGLAWETAAGPGPRRNVVRGIAVLLLVISAATNWLASFKSSPEALTVAGNELASAGAQKPAIEKYLQALRVEPDLPQAHHGLAVALATEGRLPEAVEHFTAALRTKPNFAEAHNALGVTLQRMRQPAAALAEFESALRISPHYAEAHFDCGVVLQQLNRPAEAIPHLEEVLRLKPAFPGARERLEAARRAAGVLR